MSKRKFKTVDWQDLVKGDTIKVINGHGPYMMIKGKKHRIGVPGGDYKVVSLNPTGIVARGKNGFCFIYMGLEKESPLGMSAPHKIKKYLTNRHSLV